MNADLNYFSLKITGNTISVIVNRFKTNFSKSKIKIHCTACTVKFHCNQSSKFLIRIPFMFFFLNVQHRNFYWTCEFEYITRTIWRNLILRGYTQLNSSTVSKIQLLSGAHTKKIVFKKPLHTNSPRKKIVFFTFTNL